MADVHNLEYVLDRTWGYQELCAFVHKKFLLFVVFHNMEVWPSIFELFDVGTCGELLPVDVVPVLSVLDRLLVALYLDVVLLVLVVALRCC